MTPYPGDDRRVPISTGGGREPVWSRDGQELFYRTDGELMVVAIDRDTGAVGTPTVLFEDRYMRDTTPNGASANYDVSRDGQFVMVEETEAAIAQQSIHIVLDWFDELQRLVPSP